MKKIVAGVVMVLVVGAVSGQDDASKKDLKAMEGTWVVTALEMGGKKISDEDNKQVRPKLVVKGDKYSVYFDEEQKATGTIKLDGSKKPKQMDVTIADGEEKGKTMLGIYQMEGDTMKVAFDQPGKERPTAFSTKEGTGQMLCSYKRVKK